ncbi:MAG TPA: sialidase family protein [bacterium]|nr:sialidase family protein [bacterium]
MKLTKLTKIVSILLILSIILLQAQFLNNKSKCSRTISSINESNFLLAKGLSRKPDKPNEDMKEKKSDSSEKHSADRVTAFRIRSDFSVEIDEDMGWAAAVNEAPALPVDSPFRVRFEVEIKNNTSDCRQYSLQYRWNDRPWVYMGAHEFPYPSAASPPMSIVGCDAFFIGEDAEDLISVSNLPAAPGAGISLAPTSPRWSSDSKTEVSAEWEWAVVVRRWADGPKLVGDGDRFALRMVDQDGRPLPGPVPEFTVNVPDRHLGGTFVETPARIGPYENSSGELYFIMEPTETDNVFMMVKSSDGGKSWFEVDSEHRPKIGDLEGVGSVLSKDGVIHIVHQTSDAVFYHAFATSDHAGESDRWIVDSKIIAEPIEPPTQVADITIRPDGSLVAIYGAENRLEFSVRNPDGTWEPSTPLDQKNPRGLTNPSLVCRSDGILDIVYKDTEGQGWHRQLLTDNSLTSSKIFADNLGTEASESMAILPLVYLPETNTTVAIFRQSNGYLYQRRKSKNKDWSKASQVSDRPVVTNAADSEQAGADVVAFGSQLYVAFIAQDNRDIYLSVMEDSKKEPAATRIVSDISGAWVRGQILINQPNSPVYGLIYDAGSKGGSGYNWFISHPIR